jgi:hypothetical protein
MPCNWPIGTSAPRRSTTGQITSRVDCATIGHDFRSRTIHSKLPSLSTRSYSPVYHIDKLTSYYVINCHCSSAKVHISGKWKTAPRDAPLCEPFLRRHRRLILNFVLLVYCYSFRRANDVFIRGAAASVRRLNKSKLCYSSSGSQLLH